MSLLNSHNCETTKCNVSIRIQRVFIYRYMVYKLYIAVIYSLLFPTLCLSNALNLNDSAIPGRHSLQARSRRHRLRQEIDVCLIHGCKILHVGKVDIILDYLL